MIKKLTYYIFLFLCVNFFYACSTDDEKVFPPETEDPYFVAVTNSLVLDRVSFAERLGASSEDAFINLLPDSEVKVEAIRYRTMNPQGVEVEASGIIAYPSSGTFRGVVVGQHYTISSNEEAPSSSMATFEAALALFGYVVICPDYLGFGSTVNLPSTYIHAESLGRVTVDMVFATREYMESSGMDIENEMYVVGYSQGGYSALAFQKMAEEQYMKEMPLRKVFAGGGPYDPAAMFDLFVGMDSVEYPSSIPFTVIGLDYGDNLNLNYTNLFQGSLLSNYFEWYVSKKYTMGQINRFLGTDKLSSFMHPDMFRDEMNDDFKKVYSSLQKNSLIDWKPKTTLILVHGKKDMTVPFLNAQNAYDSFISKGCPVELKTVDADHGDTAISFYLTVLLALAN